LDSVIFGGTKTGVCLFIIERRIYVQARNPVVSQSSETGTEKMENDWKG
jgi:hypothetical protein